MIVRARNPRDIDRERKRANPGANVVKLPVPVIAATPHHLKLTKDELDALMLLLIETAQDMDDDGREGAFNASLLKPVYDKAKALRRGA
jgi:hypothetical protein